MGGLDRVLKPQSIAVVGASNDPLKRGYQAVKQLLADGFPYPIYPVNPREREVLGIPAYPNLAAVGADVDVALIVVPAETVPSVLAECVAVGVRGAVVIAVGFAESGRDGAILERRLNEILGPASIRMIGPNTSGMFNLTHRLNLVGAELARPGNVALLSQSGNMAVALWTEATYRTGLGFSVYVGVGNQVDVSFEDCLNFLRDDPDTAGVILYAEGFKSGRRLLQEVRATAAAKPVVILKGGHSDAGQAAALSHTAAIAGAPAVADAALRQAGGVTLQRSDELLPVIETLIALPPLTAPNIAVLADGGGHATVAADALEGQGLDISTLAPATSRALRRLLPPAAAIRNPVDVAGATDRNPLLFLDCAESLIADPAVGGILFVGVFGGYAMRFGVHELEAQEENVARGLAELVRASGKPIIVQSAWAAARPRPHEVLRECGIPVYESMDVAARCMTALFERGRFLASRAARSSFGAGQDPLAEHRLGRGHELLPLLETDGRRLLADNGIDTGPWDLVQDAGEAGRAAERLASPVALKVVSPDVLHKSDVGGIVLNVNGAEEAAREFTSLVSTVRRRCPEAGIVGALIAPMVPPGVELIVGVSTDPNFGPIITVGAGGTLVDVLQDAAFRVLPLTPLEAREMLVELRLNALLDGVRGAPACDRDAIVELLLAVSRLVVSDPTVVEIDLNPVVASPAGVGIADVRVLRTTQTPQHHEAKTSQHGRNEPQNEDTTRRARA